MASRTRTQPRPLRHVLLRVLAPRLAALVTAAATFLVGQALAHEPSARLAAVPAEVVATAPPVWGPADAAAYPGCTPSAVWPEGAPAPFVVVHRTAGDRPRKVAFDRAWRTNHNATRADDLWVVGVCA